MKETQQNYLDFFKREEGKIPEQDLIRYNKQYDVVLKILVYVSFRSFGQQISILKTQQFSPHFQHTSYGCTIHVQHRTSWSTLSILRPRHDVSRPALMERR